MKVTVEKYKGETDSTLMFYDLSGSNKRYEASTVEGFKYYIFRTVEKAWVKHSKKLTKQEKQWVIEHESK
jgi:hypothetical protein